MLDFAITKTRSGLPIRLGSDNVSKHNSPLYEHRDQISSLHHPHMVLVEKALWTKMLQHAGIIPGELGSRSTNYTRGKMQPAFPSFFKGPFGGM